MDELWHSRYYILTNYRLCYFNHYKGAMRRTIELQNIQDIYILETRLFKECLYIQTVYHPSFMVLRRLERNRSVLDYQ